MRCHQEFDPNNNSEDACIVKSFKGSHTDSAYDVDYSKFDICDSETCGNVLHSFTFHLKMIQDLKQCTVIDNYLTTKENEYQEDLEAQLEILQILKLARDDMTPAQRDSLDSRWEDRVDYHYAKIRNQMIQDCQQDIEYRSWCRKVDVSSNIPQQEIQSTDKITTTSKFDPRKARRKLQHKLAASAFKPPSIARKTKDSVVFQEDLFTKVKVAHREEDLDEFAC
jgi:hypothetical protein